MSVDASPNAVQMRCGGTLPAGAEGGATTEKLKETRRRQELRAHGVPSTHRNVTLLILKIYRPHLYRPHYTGKDYTIAKWLYLR